MTMRPEPYRHLETDRVFDALEALERGGRARREHGGLALAWALGHAGSVVVGPRRPRTSSRARGASLSLSPPSATS
jgi:hypothetical protein